MADKSVDLGASSMFGLAAAFLPQSTTNTDTKDTEVVMDASGDVDCEAEFNNRNEYKAEFKYCNANPDIKTDLGTMATKFGAVADSKVPTEISITFESGKYAGISVSGHNHDSNAHAGTDMRTCDFSSIIPASSGLDVPALLTDTGANSTPVRAVLTVSLNHVDANGADGEHWVGQNITFKAELQIDYIGTPTLNTTGWVVDSIDTADSNQEHDTYSIKLHKYLASAAGA